MSADSRGHTPGEKWEFDAEVTRVFDDMLDRSIPQHRVMRDLVASFGVPYAKRGGWVLDVGCSRGEALAPFVSALGEKCRYLGLEVSEPMLDSARARFADQQALVEIRHHDLRRGLPGDVVGVRLATAVLTMMFVAMEHRLGLLQSIFDALAPGGAFIVVEKIVGASSQIDTLMVERYYRFKHESGYTQDEIDRKRLSLEGVLVPLTAAENVNRLKTVGFAHVDSIWRWANFGAWIAVKA